MRQDLLVTAHKALKHMHVTAAWSPDFKENTPQNKEICILYVCIFKYDHSGSITEALLCFFLVTVMTSLCVFVPSHPRVASSLQETKLQEDISHTTNTVVVQHKVNTF